MHRPMNGSEGRGRTKDFSPEKAVDARPETYWSPGEGGRRPMLEIDMEGPVDVSALVLEEPAALAGRIREYKVEAQVDSDWVTLSSGGAVGARKVDRFPRVTAWKVRLTVVRSDGGAVGIRKFGLYLPAK